MHSLNHDCCHTHFPGCFVQPYGCRLAWKLLLAYCHRDPSDSENKNDDFAGGFANAQDC